MRTDKYDSKLLEAMAIVCQPKAPNIRPLRLHELRSGMVFADDVKAQTGLLLVARGQRASEPLLERLHNFGLRVGIVEPILCEVEN
jgi:hypothetical protein